MENKLYWANKIKREKAKREEKLNTQANRLKLDALYKVYNEEKMRCIQAYNAYKRAENEIKNAPKRFLLKDHYERQRLEHFTDYKAYKHLVRALERILEIPDEESIYNLEN